MADIRLIVESRKRVGVAHPEDITSRMFVVNGEVSLIAGLQNAWHRIENGQGFADQKQ